VFQVEYALEAVKRGMLERLEDGRPMLKYMQEHVQSE